ncbi:MAG: universal stress protein [Burkholderiaceae bacterium]|jgi:nucleotide-binding universal stress UspA family protein
MYTRVVVAVDGSDVSALALEASITLCRSVGAILQPLFVVSVPVVGYEATDYDSPLVREAIFEEGRTVTSRAVEKMKEAGVDGEARIVEGVGFEDVAQLIVTSATEFGADLLVMGTHGRRGFRRLMLGSVAEHSLRLSRIPLLLVPPKAPVPDLGRLKGKPEKVTLQARAR